MSLWEWLAGHESGAWQTSYLAEAAGRAWADLDRQAWAASARSERAIDATRRIDRAAWREHPLAKALADRAAAAEQGAWQRDSLLDAIEFDVGDLDDVDGRTPAGLRQAGIEADPTDGDPAFDDLEASERAQLLLAAVTQQAKVNAQNGARDAFRPVRRLRRRIQRWERARGRRHLEGGWLA